MTYPRFYPTCTTLGNGTVLVSSGTIVASYPIPQRASIPELFDPSIQAPSNPWFIISSANRVQPEYPHMYVLPDGNVLDAGIGESGRGESRVLSSSTWTWAAQSIADPAWYGTSTPKAPGPFGSSVMYAPGKVMKCGGFDLDSLNSSNAVASTWVLDANVPGQAWLAADDMHSARVYHNLVILPDGKVVAIGGRRSQESTPCPPPSPECGVFEADIFDPATGKWTLQPESQHGSPRFEHSTAMLLPDGRVVSAGGNGFATAQIFYPPNIDPPGAAFCPPNPPIIPRPTITSAASYMHYGQSYTIQYTRNGANEAKMACLIRLGAVTHSFDQDQRRVPLTITASGPGTTPQYLLTVSGPINGNTAPPGFYMLFILSEYASSQFAPCTMAAYVQVGP
jgi:hypothetical protein